MVQQRWRFFSLRVRSGTYLNSPLIEYWAECGVLRAVDEDSAARKAAGVVGGSRAIRVEPVSEFYRPESLQP